MNKTKFILSSCMVLFFLVVLGATDRLLAQTPGCSAESWLEIGWKNLERKEINQLDKSPKNKPANYIVKCNPLNFDVFFQLFSEDKYFQEIAILFPLKLTKLLEKYPIPQEEADYRDTVTSYTVFLVKQNNGQGVNIFPNRQQRLCDNRSFFFEPYKNSGKKISVILRGEGGIRYEYVFDWKGCWYLSEIIDSSN